MVKLGKRHGKGQRAGVKRARNGSYNAGPNQSQPRAKGPSRTMAKEENAKKRRADLRRQRFTGIQKDDDPYPEKDEAVDATGLSESESASGSEDPGSDVEEGPRSAYCRLMQALNKDVAAESESDPDQEEKSSEDEDDEDGEQLEWEEASSNDEAEAEYDESDKDNGDEELDESRAGKHRGRERGAEDDPEADRDELGLDADAPESDDEEEDAPERKKQGGGAETEARGGFYDFFLASISAEQAAQAGELRAGAKWKKQELPAGAVKGFLWRKGSVGTKVLPRPAAVDESLQEICGLDRRVCELFKNFVDKRARKKKGLDHEGDEGGGSAMRSTVSGLSGLQRAMMPVLDAYMDVQFSARKPGNVAEDLRQVMALHVVNHVLKSRDLVHRNNLKLKKKAEAEARDQGFTRCKVLIVLPCRNAAWHLIKTLLALAPGAQAPKGRVDNLGRFREEFGPGDQEDRRADRERLGKTGEDHWERFEGNNEDHFRIGIQLHSKYARLFAPFYSADIIVASPLGLRMIVKSAEEKSRETDFLSSVDMVILDQFDYLMMQNLEHLHTVMDACNLSPFRSRGADFTRVRECYLDDLQKHARQTILLSAVACPELNALLSRRSFNARGMVKNMEEHGGALRHVLQHLHVRHTFHRLPDTATMAAADVDDARFGFFRDKLYPRLTSACQTHTLIVVPSYIDFVRVRNYLKKQNASFLACTEYSDVSDVARARSEFYHARKDLLVITERFHFYHRFKIRGVQHIVFYGLPLFGSFYSELVNLMSLFQDTGGTVTAVYAVHDKLALQRVVGSRRAQLMLESGKPSHMFA